MMVRLQPLLLLLAVTLLACLPWRLPPALALAAPYLPVALAAHGYARRGAWLSDWALVAAGLAVDVATQGPLGYWPLVYLGAHAMALLPDRAHAENDDASPLPAIAAIVVAGVAGWTIRSVYDWSAAPTQPFVGAVGVAIAVYGLAVLLARFGGRAHVGADGA